jgi:hypothetical protein
MSWKLFSVEVFPNLQNRDEFFQKITQEEGSWARLVSQYLLLNVFSFLYGIVMGSYHGVPQALASGVKVMCLFSLVLLVCFPAFYVIQYILGSRLKLAQMVSIILSGFVLTTSIMVAFAPIVIFFLLTGGNYYFLQLLHIVVFLTSGIFGMKTVIDALKFSCEKKGVYPQIGVVIFRFWVFIMAFVGIQLAWNLRPFLGDRGEPFEMFRDYEGNFYTAIIYSGKQLLDADIEDSKRRTTHAGRKEVDDQSHIDTTELYHGSNDEN